MSKMNAGLLSARYAAQNGLLDDADMAAKGIRKDGSGKPESIAITVEYTGSLDALRSAGLTVHWTDGQFVTGEIQLDQLDALGALESVRAIEGGDSHTLEIDISSREVNADAVQGPPGVGTPPTTYTGANVIIGVIDTGIDIRHPAFQKTNADGTTSSRVLAIWDQTLDAGDGDESESPPEDFPYGVEYKRGAINTAIQDPALPGVRHRDTHGHGTHVASIAAGNDAGNSSMRGIAPDADLVVVKTGSGSNDRYMAALQYIYSLAAARNRPCVINNSQGWEVGPHDGTSVKERAIDRLLGRPGRAFVKSAGNSGKGRYHVRRSVSASNAATVDILMPANGRSLVVDIWYSRDARFDVEIVDAANARSKTFGSGTTVDQDSLSPGTGCRVTNTRNQPHNQLNNLRIDLGHFRGSSATLAQGTWHINLTETAGHEARFDAWIDNPSGFEATFVANRAERQRGAAPENAYTITIPGTARETIAVGAYVTRERDGSPTPQPGRIADFSSRGPTADGRIKPDIAAPGDMIRAARAGTGGYVGMWGTSMAAPHVTGAIVCLFERDPTLNQEQIRAALSGSARTDRVTGQDAAVPNNDWGHGRLDVAGLVGQRVDPATTRNWVRVRTSLYNWTLADTPPSFEVSANENGEAVIELAWDPQAMLAPSDEYAPLRYYDTASPLDVEQQKADGSTTRIQVPDQLIRLEGNRAVWTMPQALWDGYREELRKARRAPASSGMRAMLYYRVRFTPTRATSALVWPADSAFVNNPMAQRLCFIQLDAPPESQVRPDQGAIDAMPFGKDQIELYWDRLPDSSGDKQSLTELFSHRFFTNHVEAEIRGKILSLWLLAGPRSRRRLPDFLDYLFRNENGLEMTVFKQTDLRGEAMLIDHLLAMRTVPLHPDILGVSAAEQIIDDILTEIMDPNGQISKGRASTCAPTSVQTILINVNAAEYARLQRGLLDVAGRVTFANGNTETVPPAIFKVARYAGAQSSHFFVRNFSELAFQATVLKYAKAERFPEYDPSAPPSSPNGVNTVFQATIPCLTMSEMERALEGVLGRPHTSHGSPARSAEMRNAFMRMMDRVDDPRLLVVHWGPKEGGGGLHAVVALRTEAGRVYFKNPQYAGSRPPRGHARGLSLEDPPRLIDDPSQALESMGDQDLTEWICWYHDSSSATS